MLGEVESTKSVSEIYAPVAGEVVAVNDALADAPEQFNTDPYGDGWICEIVPAGRRRRGRAPRRRAVHASSSPGSAPDERESGDGTSVDGVFCNNCGHRNPASANFCSSCGAVLGPPDLGHHHHAAPRRRPG